jgi:RimJ/RimL family protein N-acetyltransferase
LLEIEMREPNIVTERLELRPLVLEDAEEMAGVLADEGLHRFTGGQPMSLPELRSRFRTLVVGRSPDGRQIWLNWVVRLRDRGHAIGTVQATLTSATMPRRAWVAWVIGVPWQGRGFASEAATSLVEWLSPQVTDVAATIHPDHAASQRVASRAGLVLTPEFENGEQIWCRPATGAVSEAQVAAPSRALHESERPNGELAFSQSASRQHRKPV